MAEKYSIGVTWVVGGIAAATFAVLREAGSLLSRISTVDGVGYGATAFTGFKLRFVDTTDLAAALNLWTSGTAPGTRILQFHVLTDLVFIAAYSLILWRVLRWVRAGRSFSVRAPLLLATADFIETALFGLAVASSSSNRFLLTLVQLFSLLKWIGFAVIVVALLVIWWTDDDEERVGDRQETVSRRRMVDSIQVSRRTRQLLKPVALTGQFVIVAIFALLVAVPGGSALDQVPDVLRAQIDPLQDRPSTAWVPLALSTVALAVFALAAVTSAAIGGPKPAVHEKSYGSALPLLAAFAFSATLAVLGFMVEGGLVRPAWAAFIVVAAVALAARIARWSAADIGRGRLRHAIVDSSPGENTPSPASDAILTDRGLSRWASSLAALVMVAGGIGLIRAAAPLVILNQGTQWLWTGVAVAGFVTVGLGGAVAQWMIETRLVAKVLATRSRRRFFSSSVTVVVLAGAVSLAIAPPLARHLGSNGAVAMAFSLYILIVGYLQRLSRQARPWRATQRLGFGVRTPWAGLAVAVWVVGSVLNSEPGYHAVRTLSPDAQAVDDYRHESIAAALTSWIGVNEQSNCGADEASTIPLVLVAAPGGGIRAAYWTGTTLEDLFPGECRDRLFVASGTSGGAVGISIWAASTSTGDDNPVADTTAALTGMSGDGALAATVSALLLRDLPQPFTGFRSAWNDRAAVLEEQWIDRSADEEMSRASPLADDSEPRDFGDLGTVDSGWAPIVVLNSASVIDGCRVLVTTIDGLPTSSDESCLAPGSPPTDSIPAPSGPSRASIDPLPLLTADGCEVQDDDVEDQVVGLSIASASLMAARWPYITPSGSLRYCTGSNQSPRDLYVVDGGYYENTGLLAILEIWDQLEPMVEDFNNQESSTKIEPWILFLDNGYRSERAVAPTSRPLELLVPLQAFFGNQVTGSAAMEQRAAFAMLDPARASGNATQAETDRECGQNYARIGPSEKPEVSAPLGWVLSQTSRESLDGFRDDHGLGPDASERSDEPCIVRFVELLHGTGEGP